MHVLEKAVKMAQKRETLAVDMTSEKPSKMVSKKQVGEMKGTYESNSRT